MHRSLGAIVTANSTLFRVWAPACETLTLEIDFGGELKQLPMLRRPDGFFEGEVPGAAAGMRYRYVLYGGVGRPDPASRFQPDGVHGWSQIVDPQAYSWQDQEWRGVAKQSLVIYELHVGTFTAAGTYLGAIDRMDELCELGINALELMPIAESAGRWNWGYDGVNFFAPRHTYGTPDDLRRFIDAAHQRGLAVILDVVYNHFGPEGNYLRDFGAYVSDKRSTAWGDAPNFDSDSATEARTVRDYFIANATYWIEEFHFDGLRLDAIHCMADDSDKHIVTEVAEAVDRMRGRLGRELHLIAESNVYDPQMIARLEAGGHGYDAAWCDDFLHSVFAVLRPGEHMSRREYYPPDMLSTLLRGFVYQGTLKEARRRIAWQEGGAETVDLESLVFSIQNHDFIGNHPLGRRLHQLASHDAHRAAAALLLIYPAIPMLFMGEEFACDDPFYFFVDYGDQILREAVERGRRAEYPQHDWAAGASPLAASAFEMSKIGPAADGDPTTRAWYQSLIAIRKQWKSMGLLHSRYLNVQWETADSYALLTYQKGSENRFAVIRMSRENEVASPLRLRAAGQIELSQNCAPTTEHGDCFLTANGVLIGAGEVIVGGSEAL